MVLSILGSAIAMFAGHRSHKQSDDEITRINRLIEIADQSSDSQPAILDALEKELNGILAWFVTRQTTGAIDSNIFSVAVSHARHAIDRRREFLRHATAAQTSLAMT
jgi:hypothetical protein